MSSPLRAARRRIVRASMRDEILRRAAYRLRYHQDKTVLRRSGEGVNAWLERLRLQLQVAP